MYIETAIEIIRTGHSCIFNTKKALVDELTPH